jgi:adenylate kinase
MDDQLRAGGNIVDFHTCDFFPERWFQLVIVLRTDNEVLYRRLEKRGYAEKKIRENVEAEIMQVVLDESRASYDEEIVKEVKSDSVAELEANVANVAAWFKQECARLGMDDAAAN